VVLRTKVFIPGPVNLRRRCNINAAKITVCRQNAAKESPFTFGTNIFSNKKSFQQLCDNILQKTDIMNHFELYGIPVSLHPDTHQLKQTFYALSRKYHPDFFSRENEFDQAEALEKSSQVNKAFKIFQSREETIKYVLQLKGLLEEEEKYSLPPDFLMEVMDLNEQLMDAKMEQDIVSTNKIKAAIAALGEEIYAPVREIVEGYEDGKTGETELLKVKEYYYKKKYLNRILATMR
jgi:molecular chaperone HscB